MKLLKIVPIILIGIFVFILPITTAQAGSPPGNWVSGISCQNLDSVNSAEINISFYAENNPVAVLSYNDTIAAGGNKNYYTPSSPAGLPSGFLGSAVVSSSSPLSCNVNTITTGAGTAMDPIRLGISASFDNTQLGPIMYLPQIEKEFSGWNSYIMIQNPNSTPVDITITYKDRYGTDYPAATEQATIPAQAGKIFYQSDNGNLPTNFLGAAKVVADNETSQLAAIANFYNSGVDNTVSQIHSYNGFNSGAKILYAPYIVRNYYGYNGGISIQNVGATDTTVTITFRFAGNDYVYSSPTIAVGASLALYTPNITVLNPVDGLNVTSRFGSAVIEAAGDGKIVAVINQSNFGGAGIEPERVGQGATYNAFLAGKQTTTVFFPQIPRNSGGIWSGGFQVSNVTSIAGTCDITYEGIPAANENDIILTANGSITRYGPNIANLPDGFNNSVTVSCTQPVFGIANLAINPGSGKLGDTFGQSNGLNK